MSLIDMASDNSLTGARDIGVLSSAQTFKNAVSLKDRNDYYTFKTNGRSRFNLSLNNLQNDVNVSLIQNRRTIASSSRKGKRSEKITATLDAGTYYVRVSQKQGGSKYQLNLNVTPLSQPTSPDQPTLSDLFYNNVFLSGTSAAYDCGLNNNPTSCLTYQNVSSVLSNGCSQGNQTACSLLLELTQIEGAARIVGMIGSF